MIEGKTPIFARGKLLEKVSRVLLQRYVFAGVLIRGFCPRQDRPHCRAIVKRTHGADGQVGSERPCLVQNRLGDFHTHPS